MKMIIDNAIIAYEAFYTMKTRWEGKMGSMDLKLDISKSYDKIE